MATLTDVLGAVGVRAFGLGMPVLAKRWTDGTLPTVGSDQLSLNLAAGSWIAPLAGALRRVDAAATGVTLLRGAATPVVGPGVLLTLFPQVELRLARLYAQVLEDGASPRPGRALGRPARPVPRYWFYAGAPGSQNGHLDPDESVDQAGILTIHDGDGMPIDPLAVAAAFQALMVAHEPLQARGLTDAFATATQVQTIAELEGTPAVVRIRLSDHAGTQLAGTTLTGLTAVGTTGLFELAATTGGGSNLTGSIGKVAATVVTGSFPPDARRLLKVGLATTGRLSDTVAFPALPTGVSLARDFFAVRVVDLKRYLLGNPNAAFDGTKVEKPPTVRINEPVDLLTDGNDVLGAGGGALSGSPVEGIAVAQAISGTFPAPTSIGATAHWPAFPPAAGVPGADPLTVGLRNAFNPTAAFFDDGDAATDNVDVILTLDGLPAEAAVRVYHRRFTLDAREERGDGAGGVASSAGTITVRLRDPLGLSRPGVPATIPANGVLHVDVMVVTRAGQARLYGNVTASLPAAPTTTAPTGSGANPFATAARRGITTSAVLGLASSAVSIPATASPVDAALLLSGEATPRDAPRLPTMARRDLLISGLAATTGGAWRSVIAAGRLQPETHSAQATLGAPGSPGGRETQVIGVSTQNGRLAYDIARMGMRRATNIVTRLTEVAKPAWNEPAQPVELAPAAIPTASAGTFAGAVLQTVAPFAETPELAMLKSVIDPNSTSRPKTFDELVDWVAGALPTALPFGQEVVDKLQSLKDDTTLNESDKERLFNESEREVMSASWGRRDAQWALQAAIANARRSIYIETPGFAPTAKDYAGQTTPQAVPPYAVDLLAALDTRIGAAAGLHVMICTPKFPDFGAGYERLATHEAEARRQAILGLATAGEANSDLSRVVAFHPIGFPGRPSRLESTVVIVDDLWALIGSSTFRRRGLTFDGGSDVVLTDLDLVEGRSASIGDFRRRLMAARLGVTTPPAGTVTIPDANWIRLRDGVEAFRVIRSMLRAGGLGRIEPLWNGITPGVPPISTATVTMDLANPEGLEFDLVATLAETTLAALNRW